VRGTYTVVLECDESKPIRVGKLGSTVLSVGLYVYTGSALGRGAMSLEKRLARHFATSKKARWHVDYLTQRKACSARVAVCLRSRRKLECTINEAIGACLNAKPVLPRIGASDCKCPGHLLQVNSAKRRETVLRDLQGIYSGFGESFTCSSLNGSISLERLPISS
jgi:Uri superfamily endonuclease